jgi:hypothetical protein
MTDKNPAARFAAVWLVLLMGAATARAEPLTHFLGGDVMEPANWSAGLPGDGLDGLMEVDGVFSNSAGSITWLANATVTVDGAHLSRDDGNLQLTLGANSFLILQDGSLVSEGGLGLNRAGFEIHGGSLSVNFINLYGTGEGASFGGTIHGGLVSVNELRLYNHQSAVKHLHLTGGTLDVTGQVRLGGGDGPDGFITIAGGAIHVEGGDPFDWGDDGHLNFLPESVGEASITVAGFGMSDYEALYTANRIRFDGDNSAPFSDRFSVSGNTLTVVPEGTQPIEADLYHTGFEVDEGWALGPLGDDPASQPPGGAWDHSGAVWVGDDQPRAGEHGVVFHSASVGNHTAEFTPPGGAYTHQDTLTIAYYVYLPDYPVDDYNSVHHRLQIETDATTLQLSLDNFDTAGNPGRYRARITGGLGPDGEGSLRNRVWAPGEWTLITWTLDFEENLYSWWIESPTHGVHTALRRPIGHEINALQGVRIIHRDVLGTDQTMYLDDFSIRTGTMETLSVHDRARIHLSFEGIDEGRGSTAWMNRGSTAPGETASRVGSGAAPIVTTRADGLKGQAYNAARTNLQATYMWGEFGEASPTPIEQATDEITSFTFTAWIKSDPDTPLNNQRLFYTPNFEVNYLSSSDGSTAALDVRVGHGGDWYRSGSHDAAFSMLGEWCFVAVTWDSTKESDQLSFYHGRMNEPVTLAGRATTAWSGPLTNASHGGNLWLGNTPTTTAGDRTFRGYVDEFRIFSSNHDRAGALAIDEIEEIRRYDLVDADEIWWLAADMHVGDAASESFVGQNMLHAVEDVKQLGIADRAVMLGDLVHDRDEYMVTFLQHMDTLGLPWDYVLGNHDFDRDTYEPVLPPYYEARTVMGIRFIFLSDEVTGLVSERGLVMSPEQEQWFWDELESYKDQPIFIFSHQPHWDLGIWEDLQEVIDQYDIRAWFSGHTHNWNIDEMTEHGFVQINMHAIGGVRDNYLSTFLMLKDLGDAVHVTVRFRDHAPHAPRWIDVDGRDEVTFTVAIDPPPAQPVLLNNPYAGVQWDTAEQHVANLHTHTTESDGDVDVHEVIDMYHGHAAGYTILAITDHDTQTDFSTTWPWTDYGRDPEALGMLAIQGNEISRTHHINSLFSDYGGGPYTEEEALQGITDAGGLAVFNHPLRTVGNENRTYDWYVDHYLAFDALVALEICSYMDRWPQQRELWDRILHEVMPARPVWGLAADDMHAEVNFGWQRAVLLVDALDEAAVRSAFENGRFYSYFTLERYEPNSLRLDSVSVDAEELSIAASNWNVIYWSTYHPRTGESEIIGHGPVLAVEQIPGYANFVRAHVVGDHARLWTQPFGVVRGVAGPQTFEQWLDEWNVPEGARGLGDDPYETGLPNLVAYATGLEPDVPHQKAIAIRSLGVQALLALPWRTDIGTDVYYSVESSTNLVEWQTATNLVWDAVPLNGAREERQGWMEHESMPDIQFFRVRFGLIE